MEASTAPFPFYLERLSLVMTTVPGEPALSAGTSDPVLCADVISKVIPKPTGGNQSNKACFVHM